MAKKVIHVTAPELSDMIERNLHTFKFLQAKDIDLSKAKFVRANIHLKELIELIVDIPVEEAVKDSNTLIQETIGEPQFKIDDTIILKPKTENAARFLRSNGYMWKVNQASANKWYLKNVIKSGKFAGKYRDITILDIPKDRKSPDNIYEVIAVISFPKEVKPNALWKELCDMCQSGEEEELMKALMMEP